MYSLTRLTRLHDEDQSKTEARHRVIGDCENADGLIENRPLTTGTPTPSDRTSAIDTSGSVTRPRAHSRLVSWRRSDERLACRGSGHPIENLDAAFRCGLPTLPGLARMPGGRSTLSPGLDIRAVDHLPVGAGLQGASCFEPMETLSFADALSPARQGCSGVLIWTIGVLAAVTHPDSAFGCQLITRYVVGRTEFTRSRAGGAVPSVTVRSPRDA